MNHIANLPKLKNRYVVLRHGHSEANAAGIIVSDPAIGIPKYGLTEHGRAQIRSRIRRTAIRGWIDGTTIVIASDFRRAWESAVLASELLGTEPIAAPELRERSFGDFEGQPNERYADVWRDDADDPGHTNHNVESANSVQVRTTGLILRLEQRWEGLSFLFVSHGDALQILLTGFLKVSASRHRSLPHLETAEIRELVLAPPTAELATPSSQ